MAVLASLEAVDWVVCFAEDTPENLLAQVRPDVLVKGGDYGVDQVVGAELVKAYGGVVKVLGLVETARPQPSSRRSAAAEPFGYAYRVSSVGG